MTFGGKLIFRLTRLLFVFLSLWVSSPVFADPVSKQQLEQQLATRVAAIEEFRFIREQAEQLGIRVWLFGGTAAGFSHYVRWDIERQQGSSKYQKERFDFDYTSIYRSTQDLDIVIDGPSNKANELQRRLAEKFPYLQGSKSAWEVRLLRESMGTKEALFKNPDFLNQHTDSNSTGMVEITLPPQGESIVKDLRDWDAETPNFLEDVRNGKLHYYFSDSHARTSRAKAGLNPPIFSVIRYLTKVFQYELEIQPGDLEKIQSIIDRFTPGDLTTDYAKEWIQKNGKKLFQHAVNMEYAWDTLEKLGLRKKLIALGSPSNYDSLSWWMNKEPLRSKRVGTGSGRTARELKITEVAHETVNFLAYESITRSAKGEPNVFISRNGISGEAAAFGSGFYTRRGRYGARGTGFTVRFRLRPEAREGTDFFLAAGNDYVVILNRNAVEVIPESMEVSPTEYFDLLQTVDGHEKGLIEKLKRKVGTRLNILPKVEADKLALRVEQALYGMADSKNHFVITTWFQSEISEKYPELLKLAVRITDESNRDNSSRAAIRAEILKSLKLPHWRRAPATLEVVKTLNLKRDTALILEHILEIPNVLSVPVVAEALQKEIDRVHQRFGTEYVPIQHIRPLLRNPDVSNDPLALERIKSFIEGKWEQSIDSFVVELVTQPHLQNTTIGNEIVDLIMKRQKLRSEKIDVLTVRLAESDNWRKSKKMMELVDEQIKQSGLEKVFQGILCSERFRNDTRTASWLRDFWKSSRGPAYTGTFADILSGPAWVHSNEGQKLIDELITNMDFARNWLPKVIENESLFSHPRLIEWLGQIRTVMNHPEAFSQLLAKTPKQHAEKVMPLWSLIIQGANPREFGYLQRVVLTGGIGHLPESQPLLDIALKQPLSASFLTQLIALPEWRESKTLRAAIDKEISNARLLSEMTQVLKDPYWSKDPQGVDWFKKIISHSTHLRMATNEVLTQPEWAKHPESLAWIKKLLDDSSAGLPDFLLPLLKKKEWLDKPEIQKLLLDRAGTPQTGASPILGVLSTNVVVDPTFEKHPIAIQLLQKNPGLFTPSWIGVLDHSTVDPLAVDVIGRFTLPPQNVSLLVKSLKSPSEFFSSKLGAHLLLEWAKRPDLMGYVPGYIELCKDVVDKATLTKVYSELLKQPEANRTFPMFTHIGNEALWSADNFLQFFKERMTKDSLDVNHQKPFLIPNFRDNPAHFEFIEIGIERAPSFFVRPLLESPVLSKHPKASQFIKKVADKIDTHLAYNPMGVDPAWFEHPEFAGHLATVIRNSQSPSRERFLPTEVEWLRNSNLDLIVDALLSRGQETGIIEKVLSQSHWREQPVGQRLARRLLNLRPPKLKDVITFSKIPNWYDFEPFWDALAQVRRSSENHSQINLQILSQPQFLQHPRGREFFKKYLVDCLPERYSQIPKEVFANMDFSQRQNFELLRSFVSITKKHGNVMSDLVGHLSRNNSFLRSPGSIIILAEMVIGSPTVRQTIIEKFGQTEIIRHPHFHRFVKLLLSDRTQTNRVIRTILGRPESFGFEGFDKIIDHSVRDENAARAVLDEILSHPNFLDDPQTIERLREAIRRISTADAIKLLSKHWINHPDLINVVRLLAKESMNRTRVRNVESDITKVFNFFVTTKSLKEHPEAITILNVFFGAAQLERPMLKFLEENPLLRISPFYDRWITKILTEGRLNEALLDSVLGGFIEKPELVTKIFETIMAKPKHNRHIRARIEGLLRKAPFRELFAQVYGKAAPTTYWDLKKQLEHDQPQKFAAPTRGLASEISESMSRGWDTCRRIFVKF